MKTKKSRTVFDAFESKTKMPIGSILRALSDKKSGKVMQEKMRLKREQTAH